MYEIRYADPMTGKVYSVVAEKLEEAVEQILKVKDEVYYRGFASNELQASPSSGTNLQNTVEETSTSAASDSDAEAEVASVSEDDGDWTYGYPCVD